MENKLIILIAFLTLFLTQQQNLYSQNNSTYIGEVRIDKSTDSLGTTRLLNSKTEEYFEIISTGVKVEEGRLTFGKCGCNPAKDGIWLKRYKMGTIESIGTYDCGNKIGQWLYFYENGNKERIEFYSTYKNDTMNYLRITFLSSDYFEFYENGNLKVGGHYEIKMLNDTLNTIIPESGELIKTIELQPKSYKCGIWVYYNIDGIIERKEDYKY